MNRIVSDIDWEELSESFLKAKPFNYVVIDDFFLPEIANKISEQFPPYEDDCWYAHDNVVEVKKLVNHWDRFPPETYQAFIYLNSNEFLLNLNKLSKVSPIYPDIGLNGGGWHIHNNVGKLNIHKDYAIHPKLGLWRKMNLIVYMSKLWKPEWGGALELWSNDKVNKKPLKKEKTLNVKFNRAVLFDTTQNSWHGLPEEMRAPDGHFRKSIALYYLTDPTKASESHKRALFTTSEKQVGNQEVEEFIKNRVAWKEGKIYFSKDNK